MSSDIRLRRQQMALIHAAVLVFMFIGHDDVTTIRFNLRLRQTPRRQIANDETHHEQCLTKRARSFSQHFIRTQWNDSAEREDERMDVFHVEVVRRNRVGNGVLRKDCGLLNGVPGRVCQ